MSEIIKNILAPQIDFEGNKDFEKFVKVFCELYRIELFKDGLDLILTKIKERDLRFEVKIIKGWDTNLGCYLTEQNKFFNKVLGGFSTSIKKKIILRQLTCNLMAHEMAHALEFESGINLGEEFRQAIGFDMKDRQPQIVTLKAEIKRLMVDALKSYPPHQFLSELFARYFELLSVSRNVRATGDFSTSEVMDFFANTTNFITKVFNQKIKNKIDQQIANHTLEVANQIRLEMPQKKFQEQIESLQKKSQGSWSKTVKSNSSWQVGYKKYQELEDKK
ncbi:MAG: hypothetical protein SFV53_06185 [Rickettsiales bacterium]|nr:hypothetical protein [Rickettsiales bacterium]